MARNGWRVSTSRIGENETQFITSSITVKRKAGGQTWLEIPLVKDLTREILKLVFAYNMRVIKKTMHKLELMDRQTPGKCRVFDVP